jgi:predicted TIM-barrel enzyme
MKRLPAGFASALSILPIHDANGELLQALPNLGTDNSLLCAAIFPIDPFRQWHFILDRVARTGSTMVINWPSVGIFDRRTALELTSVNLGYEKEIEFVKFAGDAGWKVTSTVFDADQAERMMDAGCSRLLIHPPLNEKDGKLDYEIGVQRAVEIKKSIGRKIPLLLYSELPTLLTLPPSTVDGLVRYYPKF